MHFLGSDDSLFDNDVFEASDGQIPDDYLMEKRGAWFTVNYSL